MTILILTSRDDLTADAVIDELNHRGADVARFDTADFPTGSRLAATLTGGGWAGTLTSTTGRDVDLAAVTAVWWRRPAEFTTPDDWEPSDRAWAVSEARAGLLGVLGSLDVRWVNHPAAEAAANYKPHQLATAARVGLQVPSTTVTSAPDHAHTFITDGGNPVIYKPLGGGVLDPDGSGGISR